MLASEGNIPSGAPSDGRSAELSTMRLACSWNLPAGQDAVIQATFYGTGGAVEMRNENGSFYDFRADLLNGRERIQLAAPPDPWAGRAAAEWARALADGRGFDGSTTGLIETARLIDALYGREAAAEVRQSVSLAANVR